MQDGNELRPRRRILPLAGLAVAVSAPAWAQTAPGPDFPYWHYGWGWGHMLFGSLMMIVFWGAVIVAVTMVVRSMVAGGARRGTNSRDNALELLRERFARGEIDEREFEERKRRLAS